MSLCFWNVIICHLLYNFKLISAIMLIYRFPALFVYHWLAVQTRMPMWMQVFSFSHPTHISIDFCTHAWSASASSLSNNTTFSCLPVMPHSLPIACLHWCCMCCEPLGWCAERWRGGAAVQMESRFLWWCSVGEQDRAASWHERGGGDDELDVNKLSLRTQHIAHPNKKKLCAKQQPNMQTLSTHREEVRITSQAVITQMSIYALRG